MHFARPVARRERTEVASWLVRAPEGEAGGKQAGLERTNPGLNGSHETSSVCMGSPVLVRGHTGA